MPGTVFTSPTTRWKSRSLILLAAICFARPVLAAPDILVADAERSTVSFTLGQSVDWRRIAPQSIDKEIERLAQSTNPQATGYEDITYQAVLHADLKDLKCQLLAENGVFRVTPTHLRGTVRIDLFELAYGGEARSDFGQVVATVNGNNLSGGFIVCDDRYRVEEGRGTTLSIPELLQTSTPTSLLSPKMTAPLAPREASYFAIKSQYGVIIGNEPYLFVTWHEDLNNVGMGCSKRYTIVTIASEPRALKSNYSDCDL